VKPGAAPLLALTVSARNAGRVTIAELRGELDMTSSPDLRDQLLGLLRRSSSQLIVDLSGVTYCDASGLAVLVGTERRARLLGGSLRLAAVPPAVQQVLQLTGLHRHLEIIPAAPSAASTAGETRHGADDTAGQGGRLAPRLTRGSRLRPRDAADFKELRTVSAALLTHSDAWHAADPGRRLTPVLRAMARACGSGDDAALETAARSLMSALARHPLAHTQAVAASAARLRRVLEAGRGPVILRPHGTGVTAA
jgi:anti-anti-sigma factor